MWISSINLVLPSLGRDPVSLLLAFPALVVLITLVSNGSKMLGSLIMGRKELGIKHSIIMGVALSVRFSTSIIIVKILLDSGIIV